MRDARVWEDDEPMLSRRRFVGLVATSALTSLVRPAGAQGWPTRHVRIIVPFVPGGATDVIARVMGNRLSEAWGQQVVVENRSGAGANIGATRFTSPRYRTRPIGFFILRSAMIRSPISRRSR
jgi:tripartite-type tricarboxylate transporter receptor subunit TctC